MLFLAVIEEVPVIERITYNLLYVGACALNFYMQELRTTSK